MQKIICDYNLVRGTRQTTSKSVICIMQQMVTGVMEKEKQSAEGRRAGSGGSQDSVGLGGKAW